MPEEDGATAMDNMQERFGEDRTCRSDMLADRHTDTLNTILLSKGGIVCYGED